ncbi:MAG: flavodoxin domain-containing protein [Promethearchaeati archaeon]
MKRVLLLYGTRYGSTAEISNKIKEILIKNDIEVEVINLDDVKIKNLPPIEDFNGILIGSGIKINKMTKSVRKFLSKFADTLMKEKNTLGIFISCLMANNPEDRPKARNDYIKKVLEENGIEVAMLEAFGGVLDLTENSNLGGFSKKMMEKMAEDDPNLTPGTKNDGRDWDLITKFAEDFCTLINE